MKTIKAIYLPDLAFDSNKSCIFEYKKGQDFFFMATDNEIIYDIEPLVEDENWYIFETELKIDEDSINKFKYGEVKRIPNNKLVEYINEYEKLEDENYIR